MTSTWEENWLLMLFRILRASESERFLRISDAAASSTSTRRLTGMVTRQFHEIYVLCLQPIVEGNYLLLSQTKMIS